MLTAPTATALASSACSETIKEWEQQVCCVCVSATVKTTASALGLRDAKEAMRATLEMALLLLAGYFTLTDGVSELIYVYLHIIHTYVHTHWLMCTYMHPSQCRWYILLLLKSYENISTFRNCIAEVNLSVNHTVEAPTALLQLQSYRTNHEIIIQNYIQFVLKLPFPYPIYDYINAISMFVDYLLDHRQVK